MTREEQCKKVCRILDDVLANRPTERDSLIVAVQHAFEALRQPEIIRCKDCKDWHEYPDKKWGCCRREYWDDDGQYRLNVETNHDDYCSYGETR